MSRATGSGSVRDTPEDSKGLLEHAQQGDGTVHGLHAIDVALNAFAHTDSGGGKPSESRDFSREEKSLKPLGPLFILASYPGMGQARREAQSGAGRQHRGSQAPSEIAPGGCNAILIRLSVPKANDFRNDLPWVSSLCLLGVVERSLLCVNGGR